MDTATQEVTQKATQKVAQEVFLSPAALLEHWQGHRRLTRRTTEAFPEAQLFSFAADSMRSFGTMGIEIAMMVKPTLQHLMGEGGHQGLEDWQENFGVAHQQITTKSQLLSLWDESDNYLAETWPRLPQARFHAVESAFGLPPGPNRDYILYALDNEVHHRAQGFVYLRLLGLEPPAFWER